MKPIFSVIIFLVGTLGASTAALPASEVPGALTTEWQISSAEGMDALLLIGAVSGDVMQGEIYTEEIAYVREHLSAEGLAALDEIDSALRQKLGLLTGPTLALYFSANAVEC